MRDPYRFMGHIYESLSNLYSGRRIAACKAAMLDYVQPDDRVLFAGVGYGKEAVAAAEKGARVTVVDFSETMLGKFEKNIADRTFKHPVEKKCADIFDVRPDAATYDFVFANFFLNVFPREKMDRVVAHLADLVTPGGCLVVGDFSYPSGGVFSKAFQNMNWYIAVTLFFLSTKNAFHKIYNYPLYLKKAGLTVEEVRYFTLFGQNCYWAVAARKKRV